MRFYALVALCILGCIVHSAHSAPPHHNPRPNPPVGIPEATEPPKEGSGAERDHTRSDNGAEHAGEVPTPPPQARGPPENPGNSEKRPPRIPRQANHGQSEDHVIEEPENPGHDEDQVTGKPENPGHSGGHPSHRNPRQANHGHSGDHVTMEDHVTGKPENPGHSGDHPNGKPQHPGKSEYARCTIKGQVRDASGICACPAGKVLNTAGDKCVH